jgi:hypothetical protein
LPYEIPVEEFEEIMRNVTEAADRELLTRWYKRDDNAVPPLYCLQPRTGEYTASATEQEIIQGALLTEDELLDVLSLDENVIADFKRSSPKSPSVNALPVVVWSRLYFDLEPYLIERSADGTSLLAFFHRQFGEVVMADYLADAEKLQCHSALVRYFGQQKHQIEHDGKIILWDAATGNQLNSFQGDKAPEADCNFSPDGKWVLIGSDDEQLKLFDTMTWAQGPVIRSHSAQVCACSFSRDGKLIISSSRDNTLKVWEMHVGKVQQIAVLTKGNESIESCAISPDGAWVAAGTDTGRLRLWDMTTKNEMNPFSGHQASVLWCQFSPDGTQLVSTSMDETIKLWNLATHKETMTLSHNAAVQTGYFSPDDTRILSSSWDRTLKIWDIASGKELCKYWAGIAVHSVTWHPPGESIAAGDGAGNLHLLQVQAGRFSNLLLLVEDK